MYICNESPQSQVKIHLICWHWQGVPINQRKQNIAFISIGDVQGNKDLISWAAIKIICSIRKGRFWMSAKATRTAVVFSFSTAFGLESNQGTKPSCSSFCWGTGWKTDPKPHPEDKEPLTSPAVTTKCHRREKSGSQTFPVCPNWKGKGAVDKSECRSHTHKEQQAAPNTHQETGSNLSTVSSPNLEIC